MKINYIELENIRSHKHTKITFPEGSILLWGDIGAGKSTLLYSIDYALFGFSSEIKGNTILRKGTSRGKIKINFDVGNKNVIIERILELKKGSIRDEECYITINGYREKISPSLLKSRVFKLLNYPSSFESLKKIIPFRYTVYVPQERMKEILSIDPKERLKVLRGFFNIEKYQTILENIKELKSILVDKISENEGKVNILEKDLSEKENISKERGELNERLSEKEKELYSLEEKLKEFEEIQKKYETTKDELNEKYLLLKEIENAHENLEKVLNQKLEILSSIASNSQYKEDYHKIINTLECKSLEMLNNAITKNRELILKELENLNQRKNILKKSIDEIKEKVREYHLKREKYEGLKERRKVVEIQINKEKESIRALKSKLVSEDFSILDSKKEITESITLKNEKIKDIETSIKHLLKEQSKLKGILEKKEEEIQKITLYDNCPFCKQKITEEHKKVMREEFEISKQKINSAIKDMEDKIQKYNDEKNALEEEITKLNAILDEIREKEKIKEKNEIYIKEIEEKEKRVSQLEKELGEITKMLFDLERDIEKHKEIEEKYETLMKDYENLLEKEKEILINKDKSEKELALYENFAKCFNEFLSYKKKYDEESEIYFKKKEEVKKKIQVLEEKIKGYKTKIEESEKYHEEYRNVLRQISELRGRIEELTKQLNTLKSKKEELEKIKREIKKISDLIEFIDMYFIPGVIRIEQTIMQKIRIEFEKVFREWVNIILPNADFSVYLDENFYPKIYLDQYELQYDHLSGGEKQSIALAYRLALNKILNDTIGNIMTKDILILDEPTDGFSLEQMESIRNILNYLKLKQLIIVSHENIIKDFVDTVIFIEKVNGVSRVVYSEG